MDSWKVQLHEDFARTYQAAKASILMMQHKLAGSLPQKRCVCCGARYLTGDCLELHCSNDPHEGDEIHWHCFDCLADRIERQRGYNEEYFKEVPVDWKKLIDNIILCALCHTPSVVQEKVTFLEGFAQRQCGPQGRISFELDARLTSAVRLSFRVATYYENQRRWMFSKFKASSLMFTDSRGEHSAENGAPVDLKALNRLENDAIWMEEWTCDTQTGDPQGWQYAFNWPDTALLKIGGWENAPSAGTFVRRRKMVRTMILLSAALKGAAAEEAPPSTPFMLQQHAHVN